MQKEKSSAMDKALTLDEVKLLRRAVDNVFKGRRLSTKRPIRDILDMIGAAADKAKARAKRGRAGK